MGRLHKVSVQVFAVASGVFIGGMIALLGVMVAAYVMPAWWQWVFIAIAPATLLSLPASIVAGVVAALSSRAALKDSNHD